MRRIQWVMVMVLLLTSALYLNNLVAISFWEDESWLAIAIGDGWRHVWTFATERGVHPPLYFYIAYAMKQGIGDSEYALRWLGGLIALVGIAGTYQLGTALSGGDRRVGVFSAMLAGSSIYLIYLTRLARQYTLFYTLSTLTYWVYWRWQARPSARSLWVLMLLQCANLYTHYFSAFVALGIGAHALLTRHPLRGKSWQIIIAFIGSGILFLPWLPSILIQLDSDLGSGVFYAVNRLRDIPENYLGRVTNNSYYLGGAGLLLGSVALWRARLWRTASLILVGIVGTFTLVVIVNQTLFQWYIGRNMLYTLPLVVVMYALGLAMLWRGWAGKLAVMLYLLTFLLWGQYVYDAFYPGTADWRGLMRGLANYARPDDTFVLRGESYSTDYYLRRYLGTRVTLIPMNDWINAPTYSDRIWLIDSGQAVRFEAIEQIPDNMMLTRRLVRLPIVAEFYQTTPALPDAIFGDQLALAYASDPPTITQGTQSLTLDLWWQALRTPDFNYSASVQLWQGTQFIAQVDGNFDGGRMDAQVLPVGEWVADARTLTLPSDLPAGTYQIRVAVYDWRDNTRLQAVPPASDALYPLVTLTINE